MVAVLTNPNKLGRMEESEVKKMCRMANPQSPTGNFKI